MMFEQAYFEYVCRTHARNQAWSAPELFQIQKALFWMQYEINREIRSVLDEVRGDEASVFEGAYIEYPEPPTEVNEEIRQNWTYFCCIKLVMARVMIGRISS